MIHFSGMSEVGREGVKEEGRKVDRKGERGVS